MKLNLEEYYEKRNFNITPEPKGEVLPTEGKNIFVVQKHNASNLHYDLRLEIGGVLVSWAIPKGPSISPRVRRLAIMTEPHPISYATFEGVIPKGEYGGGEMIVWDKGDFQITNEKEGAFMTAIEALAAGNISMRMNGEKLKGSFAIFKTKKGSNSWLLIKGKDDFADYKVDILEHLPKSVISNKTIEDLKE